jgi:hypothetical protein
MKKLVAILGPALTFVMCGGAAQANVLNASADPGLKSDIKLRASVGSQVAKYTLCLVKAARGCERGGSTSQVECHLATGVVDFEPTAGKYTQKFQAAILKCDTKLDLTKQGSDYHGIGCPGDCDGSTPGVQECADLTAFQATITSTSLASAPKSELPLLSVLIDSACATDNPGAMPTDDVRKTCVADNAKMLTKYASGLFKCEGKCENDFKNKIGNGGLDNGDECAAGVSTDARFNTCDMLALNTAGVFSPHITSNVVPVLRSVINKATQGLYDRFDPTGSPSDNPCGSCGDNLRQGAESCDGSDAGVCTMGCKPDCTCN